MTRLVFLVAVASLAAPRLAAACSAPPCWPGAFVPGDGSDVPANVPGLYWRPMRSAGGTAGADPSQVVLATLAAPDTPLPFTAMPLQDGDYLLIPDDPLVAGAGYTLVDHNLCEGTGEPGPHVMFTASSSAALPAALGFLTVADQGVGTLTVGTSSGSCSTDVTADRAAIELEPSADAMPWLPALQFETRVDGAAWGTATSINQTVPPGESWQGRGVDLVYELCASADPGVSSGLAAGSHQVELRATLPGSQLSLATAPVGFVLACPADPPMTGDDPAPEDEGWGGGCSSSGAGGAPGLVLVLGALVLRRRRRR